MTGIPKPYIAALCDKSLHVRFSGKRGVELRLYACKEAAHALVAQYGGSCRLRPKSVLWEWRIYNKRAVHDFIYDVEGYMMDKKKAKAAVRVYAHLHDQLRDSSNS